MKAALRGLATRPAAATAVVEAAVSSPAVEAAVASTAVEAAVSSPAVGSPEYAGAHRAADDLITTLRAMASTVTLRVVRPGPSASAAVIAAADVFARVETACTRFDPNSPLMRANAQPERWHEVPSELHVTLLEAVRAHRETAGTFDPRVLTILTGWGYDKSLPFETGKVTVAGTDTPERPTPTTLPVLAPPPWKPEFADGRVRLGPDPVDLGGIGKGLAVRWAAAELATGGEACLVEAGGDVYAGGPGPEGDGWRVAVEDPLGGSEPLAVLSLTDLGCATSSVRLRRWTSGGRTVHHLVDPRTGAPGGDGLLAVTVVHPDPAWAEVWSKTLFLAGPRAIAGRADQQQLAALWVGSDGQAAISPAMQSHLLWRGPRVV